MSVVTMKQFIRKAHELIVEGFTQGALYRGDFRDDEDDDGNEDVALAPERRKNVQYVCSVGGMRLAFAELVGIEIRKEREPSWDYEGPDGNLVLGYRETVDPQQVSTHPFYQEGMKVLGRAFYEAEKLADYMASLDRPEELLNGADGRPYTVDDVTHNVIAINDYRRGNLSAQEEEALKEAIASAFEKAIELADEDVTTEVLGDRVVELDTA